MGIMKRLNMDPQDVQARTEEALENVWHILKVILIIAALVVGVILSPLELVLKTIFYVPLYALFGFNVFENPDADDPKRPNIPGGMLTLYFFENTLSF